MERRLAAILAADVAGYSRLMGADEAGTLAALKAHQAEFVDPTIAHHQGRVVKLMGDGALVEFASVTAAVECAATIQRGMAERNHDVPEDRRIVFRIGINLGDVIIDGDDIHGDGVNVAARLEGLAEPGGMCISGGVHDQVKGKVEIEFTDIGPRKVKNIAEPVHAWRWQAEEPERARPALALPDKPSIAVLPFDNMSGDPEQEYFSDGITEDIITELSHFRWLFVISRNSSFSYRGRAVEVRRIAEELGVRYVLEGSVRKAGQRVRVTAQLIDAPADRHVWAQRYDRDLEDIFALQDEIASQIVSTVGVEIEGTEQDQASRRPPESLDAWELYQRGKHHMWRMNRDDNASARSFFGAAIERSPTFGSPHAGLAYLGVLDVLLDFAESQAQTLADALEAGKKATALDDRDGFAHFALGRIQAFLGNRDAAIAESKKGVRLSPSFALAHYGLGYSLYWFGRAADALPCFDTAIRLSPHDPVLWAFHTLKGWCHFQLGDHEAAEACARTAFQEHPKEFWPYLVLASALAEQGRQDEACAVIDDLRGVKPEMAVSTFECATPHMDPVYTERVTAALRKAGLPE
jgi:adenylate cyclase